jgi:hypothetical protein
VWVDEIFRKGSLTAYGSADESTLNLPAGRVPPVLYLVGSTSRGEESRGLAELLNTASTNLSISEGFIKVKISTSGPLTITSLYFDSCFKEPCKPELLV